MANPNPMMRSAILASASAAYYSSLEQTYGGKPLKRTDFDDEIIANSIECLEDQKELTVYLPSDKVKYWRLVAYKTWRGIVPGVNILWRNFPDVSTKFSRFM
jgi:hypothetical protein